MHFTVNNFSFSELLIQECKVTYILQNQPAHNENILQQKVAFFIRVVWKVLNRLISHLNFYRSNTIPTSSSLGNPVWQGWGVGSEHSTFTLEAEPQKFAFHNMINLNLHINLHLGLCYISWMYSVECFLSAAWYLPIQRSPDIPSNSLDPLKLTVIYTFRHWSHLFF